MRILIATGLYPPDIGGPATYTRFLEEHLPSYGISVHVCSFSAVRRLPKVIRHIVYMWRLWRMAQEHDCLYTLDTVSVGIPTMIIARLLRKKYILRVPGDYAWEQGSIRYGVTDTLDDFLMKTPTSYSVRILAFLQKSVAQCAHHIVVPSEYMKTVVARWGIATQKVTRIYSALHHIDITHTRDVLRRQYNYTDWVVTTAGRLVPWKGMAAVIHSVISLRLRGVMISLHIFGEGVERDRLQNLIQKEKAESYIVLKGSVLQEELANRIYASDTFILNTSYEGLSHQLLEVMDIGIPIITTPVGGNRELIADGVRGLLVPWNDTLAIQEALTRFMADAQLRHTCVREAHTFTEAFTEEEIVRSIVTFFKQQEICM
jgi:glycosyltransferase involved in cell wall biosynthesis